MKAYYYHTTYFPVQYEERISHQNGVALPLPDLDPMAESLLENPDYGEHLALMGNDGWELSSVQPLLRGVYEADPHTKNGFGYPLTAGFFLFWKKEYDKAPDPDEDKW